MDAQSNNLNWFEIPVIDLARAKSFYESIFDINMDSQEMGEMQLAFFPYEPGSGKAAGGLAQSKMHIPSKDGAIIYLNANPSLDEPLSKVEAAGGQVIMPKTQITEEYGYMAFFFDTEGNRVGLHSQE